MITYTPRTPMESAVFETGHFEFSTDSAGREVVCVGHDRLPRVVLLQKADGLRGLVEALEKQGGRTFSVTEGDPWRIETADTRASAPPEAAEEYLVMGLRPLTVDLRPVRVAAGRELVRLFLAPWSIPALSLDFGNSSFYALNTNRNVIGDWTPLEDNRGMVIGIPELWCSIIERQRSSGSTLVYRCDVPMPWVSPNGLTNAVPSTVGVYELERDTLERAGTWVAKLPVFMSAGNAVEPATLPPGVSVSAAPDGPWELEVVSPYLDFDMSELDSTV